jgi:membrane protein implicated in regulation of membrane protease activity
VRERVVKYMAYYVALVAVLLVVRFATRDSEAQLRDLRDQADELVAERSKLRRDIATLESPPRVREWAVRNEMIPFTASKVEVQKLEGLKASPTLKPVKKKLEVTTQWR